MRVRKKLTFSLTSKGSKRLEAQLKKIEKSFEKSVDEGLKKTTEVAYKRVIDNASYNHIDNHLSSIEKEYDSSSKTGKVFSNDPVIIFNEFGTGIRGTQDEWADKFGYQVNASGKGESGWFYPTNEEDDNPYKHYYNGQLYGFTHGLPSRHMFYDAYLDTKKQIGNIVMVEISKSIGGGKEWLHKKFLKMSYILI